VREVLALVSVACALVSVALASALVARDPGLRVNRILGLVPVCTAWWGIAQAAWILEGDAATAAQWVRLSGLGWMPLGALTLHIFTEIAGAPARGLRRGVPVAYVLTACGVAVYVATPWGLASVFPTAWGWGYRFGPAFPLIYAGTVLPPLLVMLRWRHVLPPQASFGERRVSRVLYAGVGLALVVASLTDVVLPWLGLPVPQLAVLTLTGIAVASARQLWRFGYSLLSPAAFAREILDTLTDGVALLHPDGRIRDGNAALAALVGTPLPSLRGRPSWELLPGVEALRRGAEGARSLQESEADLCRASGERMPVVLSSCSLEREPGRLVGAALVMRDRREVAGLRRRLVTAGRLAAVGELSAGIAHDIREPIEGLRRDLDDLREAWGRLSGALRRAESEVAAHEAEERLGEGEELVDECREGADRVAAIVRDVAGLASRPLRQRESVEVAPLVERAVRVAVPRDASGIAVELELAPVPAVEGVPQQLEQVLVNLLHNARHALRGAGRVRISTWRRDASVCIAVEDDGPGIPPDVRDRVFDPFFTTKGVGEGTGLGLAISYHIVRSHGGEIHVDSPPGSGARFTVELPAPVVHRGGAGRIASPGAGRDGEGAMR